MGASDARLRCLTWIVFSAGIALRLGLAGLFQLSPDETNYWQWSRHLDLGYHDHPPMIAWSIALATRLLGQHELAVRLPTILGVGLALAYINLLAARWFGWRAALHVCVLGQGLLLFNGCALIATPDGMLLSGWAGACYHGGRALEREDSRLHWLLCGLWFGFGILSKYTMFLFLPALLCFLLWEGDGRRLRRPWPWIGLLLGLCCFFPVMLWNAHHDWPSFRHVLHMGGIDRPAFFSLRYIGDYVGAQAALLSPLVFFLLVAAWLRLARGRSDWRQRYLGWTSFTAFAVFLLLSLHSRVYGNWPAPAYLSALILIAALYGPTEAEARRGGSRVWRTTVFLAYLLCLPVLVQVVHPLLPLPLRLDRTARETKGWDQLAEAVDQARAAQPPDTFIFGIRYQLASELAFYMKDQPRTVCINRWTRPNVYDFWWQDEDLLGRDAIGVTESPEDRRLLTEVFTSVAPPEPIKLFRYSPWYGRELVQTFYLHRAHDFQGGLRWRPREAGDVRAALGQVNQGGH